MGSWQHHGTSPEEMIDAYLDGEADATALEPQTRRLLENLKIIHTTPPSEAFESALSASLQASADYRRGKMGWVARVGDGFQDRRGGLRLLAAAAALLVVGFVIGVMLPIEATARPSGSQSRLAEYVPVRPGWDDLARVPGGSGRAPSKSLLANATSQANNGVRVTVKDVVLGFGPGGQAMAYPGSYDAEGVIVYSQLTVLLEVDNQSGGEVFWEPEPRLRLLAENARQEELRAASNVTWEQDGRRSSWPARGDPTPPAFAVPPGNSQWTVPLVSAQLPPPTKPPTEVDAILWHTPAVSLVVGSFVAGTDRWDYRFERLVLGWERPVLDPNLSRWRESK